jgi:hypothetical protein
MPVDTGVINLLTRVFDTAPSAAASVACLATISAAALWWAARVVERREYVLEQ